MNVEVKTTSHTHSLNPMTTLTHVQDEQAFEALTDEELDSVDGGLMQIPLIIVGLIAGSLKG